MYRSYGNRELVENEINGHFRPDKDTLVQRSKFGAVCRVLWPNKTDMHLAAIAGKDERTARRWLADEYEPPASVALAVFQEIFKRD